MDAAVRLELERVLPKRVRARRWSNEGGDAAYASNAHDGLELGWVDAGALRYRIGSRVVDVEAGQVVVVPSGVEHACEFRRGMRGGSLHVDESVFASVLDDAGFSHVEPGLVLAANDVRSLGAMIVDELAHDSADGALCARALVDAVVVKSIRSITSSVRPPHSVCSTDPRVRRAIEYVHAHFRAPVDVDDIAAAASTSRFHLSRLMKSSLGISPYQLLIDVRLEESARLLREGRSVTDAALSSGFSDLSRFAAMFARKHKTSPKQYALSFRITASTARTTAARTR